MAYTVTGWDPDGVAYTAEVSDAPGSGDAGVVSGTPNVVALLLVNDGEHLRATPTGPDVILDVNDPATILPALAALTTVTGTSGDAPELYEPPAPDAVF